MDQMATLFMMMEQAGYMPETLAAFWFAMVPKGAEPSGVLSIRPISILSVLYRSYASVRAGHVQQWAQEVLHPAQVAYVRGRQVQPVLAHLNAEVDKAEFDNDDMFILSLDTSKAFPSVGHSQVFLLLQSYGFPLELIRMMQQLYRRGAGRLRYGGQVVHHQEMKPCRGIHQGCPLSVLAFNILLKPMCDRVTAECDAQLIVFADDVTIKTRSYEDLVKATRIVAAHFHDLQFNLNENKTQYWRHSGYGTYETINVNGVEVTAKDTVTILGWQFGRPRRREQRATTFLADLKKLAEDAAGLPMVTYHKTNAISAIFFAAKAYCPWVSYLERQVDITTARKHVLQAVLKHHVKGPRASVVLTIHALKGHAIDPQLAVLYRMVKIIGDAPEMARSVLQTAYDREARPTSLCTCLAHGLRRLGGVLQEGWWSPTTSPPVALHAPPRHNPQARALWLHEWRRALRTAIVAQATIHRHEFVELRHSELNVDQSLQLHRRLQSGRDKTYLELVLSGGMLTKERCNRHRGPPHTWCPLGCQALIPNFIGIGNVCTRQAPGLHYLKKRSSGHWSPS